jgi:hypothetical protein
VIHLFEPHGDDALLSCYSLLKRHSDKTVVVTVGHSRESKRLADHFPGIQSEYGDVYEIKMPDYRAAYKTNYWRWKKLGDVRDNRSPWEWQRDVTRDGAGELWKESRELTREYVLGYLQTLWGGITSHGNHLVLAPLGLVHPYHICLADVMIEMREQFSCPLLEFGFYSEAPYNSAKWVKELENTHPVVSRHLLVSMMQGNDGSESSKKEAILKDVYPTELGLLRFTRDAVLSNAEYLYIPVSWSIRI